MLLKEESALKCRVWNTEIANVVISQRDGTYQIWYLSVGFSPPPALCQSSLHHLHVRCNLSSSLRSKTPRGDFSSAHFEIWEKPVSRARQDRTEDRGQRGGLLAMWHSGTRQGWTTFLLEIPLSKSIHICSFPHEVQLSSILFSAFYASSSSINFGSLYLFIPTPDLPSQFPILVCLSLSFIHSSCSYAICNLGGGQLYLSAFSCIRASCSVLQCIGMFSVYSPVYFSVISAFSARLESAFSLLAALAARDMHSHSSQQSHLSSGLGLGPVPLAAAASGPYPIPCSIPEEFLVAPVADECESVSHFLFSYSFGKYKILCARIIAILKNMHKKWGR